MADLDLQSLGMRLGEAITPTPRDAPQVRYGTIDAVNADGTLDVTIDGTTLRGMCATTGCVGAVAGMRCVILRQGPLATVVGLVASADLSGVSADSATLVGDLAAGGDAAIAGDLAVGGGATFTGRVHELANLPVLWTGGWVMNSSQTVPLAENISDQAHGVILVWSWYSGGQAQDYNFNFTVVPKWHVLVNNGAGIDCMMSSNGAKGHKYLYVSDDSIKGYADNMNTKTFAGVTHDNASFVLRAVLGF